MLANRSQLLDNLPRRFDGRAVMRHRTPRPARLAKINLVHATRNYQVIKVSLALMPNAAADNPFADDPVKLSTRRQFKNIIQLHVLPFAFLATV